jgi:hypothetical protein
MMAVMLSKMSFTGDGTLCRLPAIYACLLFERLLPKKLLHSLHVAVYNVIFTSILLNFIF